MRGEDLGAFQEGMVEPRIGPAFFFFMVAPCLISLQKLVDWSGFQVASNRSYKTLSYLFMIFISVSSHILN